MIRRKTGFTLIEVLVVIAMMGLVLAMTSEMSINMLRNYKQQSKGAESNIEGILGLEMLRRDVESAGYGLPWVIPGGTTYQEAVGAAAVYNDSPSAAPRAVLSGDNIGTGAGGNGIVQGSDYLVLKGINLAQSRTCARSNILEKTGPQPQNPAGALAPTDRVIILSPGSTPTPSGAPETTNMVLLAPTGANLAATMDYQSVAPFSDNDDNRLILGVDPATNLRMPFNRADYYVSTAVARPARCAPGTGVLVKAIVSHVDGDFSVANTLPLLDCVADMQVATILTDAVGAVMTNGAAVDNALDAQAQRASIQEVVVSILAQEGQFDRSYSGAANPVEVGPDAASGNLFNFITVGTIPNWQNYRWKVYTLVARPNGR